MGDYADMTLEGYLCECCGEYIDEDVDGFPRKCEACEQEEKDRIN